MNVDAKIASKALAMRVKRIIYKLVYIDQTAYIKGRFIGESVRLIEDLLVYADQENEDGILFAADIEKAFDSVEHSFIHATLEKFGFGGNFIQWIRTLLNDAQSCVVNNGFSTGYFKLQRGNRQGDPLSPYLFIIMLEVFFFQIRNGKSVRGFKIGDIEVKFTAFADDITFFVKDKASLRRILKIMSLYSKYSSLRADCEKCEASWIGGSKTSNEKPANCRWVSLVSGTIKILGIHRSCKKKLAQKENFTKTVTSCKRILGKWKQRWLTVFGKYKSLRCLLLLSLYTLQL